MQSSKFLDLAKPTSLLAIGVMMVILIMVLPVPAWVLDVGLTLSFALAILILTTTIFIEKPLDFSSFPSILLTSLILRLALNVSSTKLIIAEGHTGTDAAGGVIEGFAMFIMGGNLFVGLVVFSVLVIVNFMVITKGAGRMAEVGARPCRASSWRSIPISLSGPSATKKPKFAANANRKKRLSWARSTGLQNSSRAMQSQAC